MRYWAVLFAAAVWFAASSYARADDAAALLGKHHAFVGWQFGDGTFKSIVLDGEMIKQGETAPAFTTHAVRMGIAHRETTVDVKRGTGWDTGFSGKVYWYTDDNGFTLPENGADVQKDRVAEDLLFNEMTSGLQGTVRGTATVDGVSCTTVRVQIAQSSPLDVCVDPQTGAYKRAVIDAGTPREYAIDILAYTDALPGKKLIGQWRYSGSAYTHSITKITANAVVPIEALNPPAQSAHWTFASGQAVKLDYRNGDPVAGDSQHRFLRGFFVNAVVNGVPCFFQIDTGADGIVLNKRFAGRVRPKFLDTTYASGIGGTVKTQIERIDSLQIGGNVLHNAVVFEDDLDDDPNYAGLLGSDLFAGALVSLDLDNGELTLFDPSQNEADESKGITLSVDLSSGQPTVPMMLDKRVPIDAILDSGNLVEVTLAEDLRSKYGVAMAIDPDPERYNYSHITVRGVGGQETMECGTIDDIDVGPIVYQAPPSCYSRTFLSGNQVLLGFDFLKNFDMLFDYPAGKLVLIPRKDVQ